jgi:hypothetical protein
MQCFLLAIVCHVQGIRHDTTSKIWAGVSRNMSQGNIAASFEGILIVCECADSIGIGIAIISSHRTA